MEPNNGTIRVAIVEDDRSLREGLGLLINATPGYNCQHSYGSVEDALRDINKPDGHTLPDILLLDIHLPGMLGSDGVKLFREKFPSMQVLMLTVYAEQDKIFESICNGACGYLLKKTPPAKLLEAIREAHEGGAPMSPEIARQVVSLFAQFRPAERAESSLTPHETRVLKLLVEGHTLQAAADVLGVTRSTVAFHVRHVYGKLQVHSRSEAVAKALRDGLVR